MRILTLAMAFMTLATPAVAETPQEIADLSLKGYEQLRCSALAGFAEKGDSLEERHFNAGLADLRKFLSEVKVADPKAARAALGKTTPMLVIMNLGGPSDDFVIGRIYSDVLLTVDDGLRNRETWTHQKKDPNADDVSAEGVRALAQAKYREHNCALLN